MPFDDDGPRLPYRDGSIAAPIDEERANAHMVKDRQHRSPDELRPGVSRKQILRGFIYPAVCELGRVQPRELRAKKRRGSINLLQELNLVDELCKNVCTRPPYDLAAVGRLREFLEDTGFGAKVLLAFEMVFEEVEDEEWDMIEYEDWEEQWEMV